MAAEETYNDNKRSSLPACKYNGIRYSLLYSSKKILFLRNTKHDVREDVQIFSIQLKLMVNGRQDPKMTATVTLLHKDCVLYAKASVSKPLHCIREKPTVKIPVVVLITLCVMRVCMYLNLDAFAIGYNTINPNNMFIWGWTDPLNEWMSNGKLKNLISSALTVTSCPWNPHYTNWLTRSQDK